MSNIVVLLKNLPADATSLVVQDIPIVAAAAEMIAVKLDETPSLREIRLEGCGIGGKVADILIPAMIRHPGLTTINLSKNSIKKLSSFNALLQKNPRILALDLSHSKGDFDVGPATDLLDIIADLDRLAFFGFPLGIYSMTAQGHEQRMLNRLLGMQNLVGMLHPINRDQDRAYGDALLGRIKKNREPTEVLLNNLSFKDPSNWSAAEIDLLNKQLPGFLYLAERQGRRTETIAALDNLMAKGQERGFSLPNLDAMIVTGDRAEPAPAALQIDAEKKTVAEEAAGPAEVVSLGELFSSQPPKPVFAPIQSAAFEKAVIEYGLFRGLDTEDALRDLATSKQGGIPSLNLMDNYLQAEHGLQLDADVFCQSRGALGRYIGQAFFSEAKDRKEPLSNILQFLKEKKRTFSAQALLAFDSQNKNMLGIMEEEDLLDALFDPTYWKDSTRALEELLDGKKLPFHVQRRIEFCLNEVDGREIPPIPPRPFSITHDKDHGKNLMPLLRKIGKPDSAFPLLSLALNGISALTEASALLERTTGYPLEADDFFRVLESSRRNILSYESVKNGLPIVLTYLKRTDSKFSAEIFSVKNDDGKTPLEGLRYYGLLDIFFDVEYWRNNVETLRAIAELPENEAVKKSIDTCLAKIEGRPILQPPAPVETVAKKPGKRRTDAQKFSPHHGKSYYRDLKSYLSLKGFSYKEPLIGIAYRRSDAMEIFHKISEFQESKIGRPLEADDFCRLNDQGLHSFYFREDLKGGLASVMTYLKDTRSIFSIEALQNKCEGRTPLEKIQMLDLETTFFDPTYWQMAPDVLEQIAKVDNRLQTWVSETQEKIRQLRPDQRIVLEGHTMPTGDTEEAPVSESLQRLTAFKTKIVLPEPHTLYDQLSANAENLMALWGYGEDLVAIRRDFALAAMEVTTSGSMQDGSTVQISRFLQEFSAAREILNKHAEQMKASQRTPTPAPTTAPARSGFGSLLARFGWGQSAEEKTEELADLGEAIRLTHQAGQTLKDIVPGLQNAERRAIEKLAIFDTITETNKLLSDAFGVYIEAGEAFLAGERPLEPARPAEAQPEAQAPAAPAPDAAAQEATPQEATPQEAASLVPEIVAEEPQPEEPVAQPSALLRPVHRSSRPSEMAAVRFEERLNNLRDIRTGIDANIGIETMTSAVFCKQASSFSIQNGSTVVTLANQVAGLHRTLDLLQTASGSLGLASASRQASGEQISDLVLAAQKTMDAITETAESTRRNVQQLDIRAMELMNKLGGLPGSGPALPQTKEAGISAAEAKMG